MSKKYYSGDLVLIHPQPSPQTNTESKTEKSVLVRVEVDGWIKPAPVVPTFPEDLERRFHTKKEEKPLKGFLLKCHQSEVPYSILCLYGTIQIFFALIFYFSRYFLFLEYILYAFIMAPFVKIILTVYVNFQKIGGVCSGFLNSLNSTNKTLAETLRTKAKLVIQSVFPIFWVRIFIVDNSGHRISGSMKLELTVLYLVVLQAYYAALLALPALNLTSWYSLASYYSALLVVLQAYYALLLTLPALNLTSWYSLASYYSVLLTSMLVLNHMVVHGKAYSAQIIDLLEAGMSILNLLYLVILPLRAMPSFYLAKETRYRRVPWITTLYFRVLFVVYHVNTSLQLPLRGGRPDHQRPPSLPPAGVRVVALHHQRRVQDGGAVEAEHLPAGVLGRSGSASPRLPS